MLKGGGSMNRSCRQQNKDIISNFTKFWCLFKKYIAPDLYPARSYIEYVPKSLNLSATVYVLRLVLRLPMIMPLVVTMVT